VSSLFIIKEKEERKDKLLRPLLLEQLHPRYAELIARVPPCILAIRK